MKTENLQARRGINITWTPSMSHRSPTSNGCMTNKKIIASNMVLQVFPNMNATKTSCELTKRRNFVVAISNINSQITRIIMATKKLSIR